MANDVLYLCYSLLHIWWVSIIIHAHHLFSSFIHETGIGLIIRGALFTSFVLRISRSLHDISLKAILRAPMSYFDDTPTGQILCTFARDLFLVDELLPDSAVLVLAYTPVILGAVSNFDLKRNIFD